MAFRTNKARWIATDNLIRSVPWGEYDRALATIILEFMDDPRRPKRWKKRFEKLYEKYLRDREGAPMPELASEFWWLGQRIMFAVSKEAISVVTCAGMPWKKIHGVMVLIYPTPSYEPF